jgi:hypothetical protein
MPVTQAPAVKRAGGPPWYPLFEANFPSQHELISGPVGQSKLRRVGCLGGRGMSENPT